MANWQPCDGSFVAQAISENSTTQKVEIGRRIKCIDASVTGSLGIGEFVYLIGVASTAIGTAVIYDRYTGLTTRASANAKGPQSPLQWQRQWRANTVGTRYSATAR